jgi:hypothetical protein
MAYNLTAASSQYLSTGSTPISTFPCTLACWFRVVNNTTNHALVAVQDAGASSRFQLSVNPSVSRAVQAAVFNSSNSVGILGMFVSAFSANTWYHSCGTFPNQGEVNAYFNGAIGTTFGSGALTVSGLDQVLVGTRTSAGTNGLYMNGLIAEVGIWNAALTAAEIAFLAKGMTCDKVRPQNLVFYAPLVRDLIDQKGGLTITNNNGATIAEHPRVYA